MYYVIETDTGRIIDSLGHCPDPQEQADLFECDVYIIEGQHSGLSASCEPPQADDEGAMQ